MLSEAVKNELKRIVGDRNASFAREDLLCYSYDATNRLHPPEAVVFPCGPEEISLILKMANSERFPVVPRGAGTGFTGGSLPVEGGVVVSTERMNRVPEIDVENLTALVEPGVVTWEFQQEVEKIGLFYPPDPSSLKFSTIGGNIAECAGGPRAIKYGVTRDYVLGLEVVLPTGDIIQTGVRTAKGVVGYDLTRLLVGSEGTLGIITKSRLKLLPLPEETRTIFAVFNDLKDAASTVSQIISSRIIPSTLELMDSTSIRCVEEYTMAGLPDAGAILLIETDGPRDSADREARAVREICMSNNASRAEVASGKKEVKALWEARRSISPALFRAKPDKINEDIVVPRSRITELITGLQEIAGRRNLLMASFGHAGDGNIHANIMYDRKDPAEAKNAEEAVAEVFALALRLNGTISGEHGIGVTKAPYLGMELSPEAVELMKGIKKTFDPNGVLNPGKIFTGQKAGVASGIKTAAGAL